MYIAPVNFKSLPFLLPKRNCEFREKEAEATQKGGGHALPRGGSFSHKIESANPAQLS